jgi:K(+)-stimulated pyrophosphate-energized sodium pump
VGNTTKALTKGYAIGSAALAAFLLFSAYITEIASFGHKIESVNLAEPHIFVAGMLGAMLVFLFSSLAIRAVGKAAYDVINAVRKQFKEHPGILKGTELPDYGACVDSRHHRLAQADGRPRPAGDPGAARRRLVFRQFHPSGQPTVSLAPEAVAAFLMVATIAGILMALFFNNGGGAWDNAKKFIETGMYGGKRSDAHKAAVVGDTVGDPFKDTAGPALHVLIKLLSTITLVLAPFFI